MSWYKGYKGSFLNMESDSDNQANQQLIDIYIWDTDAGEFTDQANQLIIPMEMAGTPLKIAYVNNADDKFDVFCSMRAEITIHSTGDINSELFAEGGDNRWYVEIFYDSQVKFIGWLSISDIQQDFLPDPNELTLIATDGLGFLEDEDLVNDDGDTPRDENQIIDYLRWSLSKTGLSLTIAAIFNIRERFATPNTSDDSGDGHFFKWNYLDAKTFESTVGACENCRDVIEKILKKEARIMQRNGEWVIIRIDELQYGDLLYVYNFGTDGVFIDKEVINPTKLIGEGALCGWMNDDCVRLYERKYKSVELVFRFNYPFEIPCNSDFARGDFREDLPDEVNSDGVTQQVKAYEIECWEFLSREGGQPNQIGFYDQPPISDSDAYVKKFFINGREVKKELIIEVPSPSGTGVPYVKSSPVFASSGDKVEFNVTLSYSNIGSNTGYVDTPVMVGLFADSGNIYWWKAFDILDPSLVQEWVLTPPTGPGSIIIDMYFGASIENPPLNINLTSPGLPESGTIYVYLMNQYADEIVAHFEAFSLGLIPLINGSYQAYTGQMYRVTEPTDPEKYKAKLEDEVFIADAPRKLMKGCLLKADEDIFVLNQGFYNAAVFPDGPPDETVVHPYGKLQIYDVWNQYYRTMRKFEGTVDKLDTGSDIPDMLHKYMLTDADTGTLNKLFMSLKLDQDVHMCETDILLVEVHDTSIAKLYPDSEFKYLTDNE